MSIELMEPSFSPGSLPGVDSPLLLGKGAWRLGLWGQYERDPLILYRYGEEQGPVVANRTTAQFGGSYDWSGRLSTRFMLPVSLQSGGVVEELAADGLGLGDARVGARYGLVRAGSVETALRGDLYLPVGRREAYLGETLPRLALAMLTRVDMGRPELLADLGFLARGGIVTEHDLTVGSQLTANMGLRYRVWPGRLSLNTGVLARAAPEALFQQAGENTAEWFGGLQTRSSQHIQLDVGVGKGLAAGFGSTAFRGFIALTWMDQPPTPLYDTHPEPPPLAAVVTRLPTDPTLTITELQRPDRPWEDGELARIERMQITIREPIQFDFATADILPESLPILQAVAALMNDYWQIGHLVIEGHASEEGSYEYNFDLSVARARAIFQELLRVGVHPDRLSFRGLGEVAPVDESTQEESLAANRRVEFHIIQLLDPLDPKPSYSQEIALPWSGEKVAIHQTGDRIIGGRETAEPAEASDDQKASDILEEYLKQDETAAPDEEDQ